MKGTMGATPKQDRRWLMNVFLIGTALRVILQVLMDGAKLYAEARGLK